MKAWLQKVVSLKERALYNRHRLDEAKLPEEASKARAFLANLRGGVTLAQYNALLRGFAEECARVQFDRARGFKVGISLTKIENGGWFWNLSVSGTGSQEDLAEILKTVGVPEGVEGKPLVHAKHWMWPDAAPVPVERRA